MGGKGKNKGKHHNRSHNHNQSHNDPQSRMTEDQMCELVAEASDLHQLINIRHEQLRKLQNFAYLISTKWLREWKDYVGYDDLFANSDQSKSRKKMGKKKPGPPNTDIIGSNRGYFEIPEKQMPKYSYLNKILKEKVSQHDDYISITPQLWNKFNSIYGPGEQIKRPIRRQKSGKNYIDHALFKTDMIFINYNDDQMQDKLKQVKNITNKFLDEYLPSNTMPMSCLWELEDLYDFIGQYCENEFGSKQVTIWRCQSFIGMKTAKEQFISSVKKNSYEVYAYKLQTDNESISDLDVDEFLKEEYILIVEVGDSKIVTARLPDEIIGFCDECVQKKKLKYSCQCQRVHYCSKECQSDDIVFHFRSCQLAFDSDDDEEYSKKKGLKTTYSGLKNLGNTCYMNSSVQMLLGFKFITQTICSSNLTKIVNEKQKNGLMLLNKLKKTFISMSEIKDHDSHTPWSFKSQINYFLPPFKGYKQHDAMDFLSNFLTLVNQCIAKPSDAAYCQIFQTNLLGQYDSFVICPNCALQVKNQEDFMQVTLPIKPKTNKIFTNYVSFQTPLICTYGKSEVLSSWEKMSIQVSGKGEGLIFMGRQGEEELIQIDRENECPEKVTKKTKKDLLFFPSQKLNSESQIWISCNLINLKSLCGEEMRAISGYPFPIILQQNKTIGHLFLTILQKFCKDSPVYDEIKPIQEQYRQVLEQKVIKLEVLEKYKKQEKQENKGKQENKESKENKEKQGYEIMLKQIEDKTEEELTELNKRVQKMLEDVKLKVFIEDKKKIKNVCFFCHKKCKGCELKPMFEEHLTDYFAHKLRQAKLSLLFQNRLQIIREKVDIGDNGDSNLQDCLALFAEPEQLDEENAWWCATCEDMRLAYKQINIKKFPKYFLIQLSRFKNGLNGKVKNNEPISYKEFEMFGGCKYRLIGVIVHQGSIEGGHYWGIGLRGDNYFIFNDQKVHKTDKYCNKGAYILAYKQEE